MAALDDILQANARAPTPPEAPGGSFAASKRLCVVTCIDPRLTRFFSTALGLQRGEATIVRLPGPAVASGTDLVRAVAAALYVNGCDEVLVLAHTDCGMVRSDAASLSSARYFSKNACHAPASFALAAYSRWNASSRP